MSLNEKPFRFKDEDYKKYTLTAELSEKEEALFQNEKISELKEKYAVYSDRLGHGASACVVTFGCQMNARDSEKLSGVLAAAGFKLTDDEEADVVVYNTCTVRDNANQRVLGRLGHLHSLKDKAPQKKITLCGCMVQEPSVIEKIKKTYSFVDLIFGTHNVYKFPELLCRMFDSDEMLVDVWKSTGNIVEELPVIRKYPFKSGVNIMFGCDKFCTYCIVPYVRGRERSRASKEILEEVRSLAYDGVSEIMLLGQNVDSYGKNIPGEISFAQLLKETEKIEGIERIRFMTSHPRDMSDEVIDAIASSDKISRHLHLPVQAGSDKVLKAMNRGYTRADYMALVKRIKDKVKDIALTTDLIVGFPSETADDVKETIDLVNEVSYDNAFTFIFSPRRGTPAADMEMKMSGEEIKENFDLLLKAVQENARKNALRLTGTRGKALVEERDPHDESMVTGRLSNNYLVHFPGNKDLIGKYVTVELTENRGFYFYGRMV